MLTVEHLHKAYNQRPILIDVSFALQPGEIVGLIGANGAGKSTLIKSILGILKVKDGQIAIGPEGYEPGSLAARQITTTVPELPLLYTDVSAYEHLRYMAMLYEMPEERFNQRAERLLRSLHLWKDRDLDPLMMSKGMKQKVSLAAALLPSPKLLLLDEPFSGLDPMATDALRRLIQEAAAEGTTVLMSTHLLSNAERLCHRFLMLYEGRLVGDGTAESLRQQAGCSPDAPLDEAFIRLCQNGVAE